MNSKSTDKTWAEIVGSLIGGVLVDLAAAWALMRGLNDLHVDAGFVGCFLICVAVHSVIGNGVR